MEDQISRTNEDSWSKDLAEIRSMLQELVAISKPTPLEFQRFCGENPDLWISQAERYFGFYAIEENQKLSLASSYLDGEALTWYQWLFQNKQLADWEHFTAKVLIRFRKRHLKSPEGRVANLWQWSDISNSLWTQNNDKQSEYPTKIYEHKVFDEMLNSNCSKVFNVAPLDTPIEMPDDDAIGPGRDEVQLFHESPQINMSERYVTKTSLDCGSCHQQIECDIPTSELISDEIITDINHGKYNKGVEHDEGRAIMDPPEWDPGVTSTDMALTGCTVNVEPLLLLGSTGAFCFITHANDKNQVWDPRQRWSHLLIFSADTLVCASYYDVVGKIHREGIAQVFSSVIAGQTEKILRNHVAFQMVIVFDPGGCTFDVPILEDMNGVLAEISKAWNFSMANPFDGQNREMSNTIAQEKRLKCDVKVRGLIVTLKWWLSKHDTYATTYRTFVLFAILRDLYAHVHTKWLTAVELVLLVTLATVALTKRDVITTGKSYFILVGGQSNVCKTNITTMLKHYFSSFGGLRSIEEHPVEHDVLNTDHRASSSWLNADTAAVAFDSLSSLEINNIIMSLWLHLNLEDKVLFEERSIVVNQVKVYGLEVVSMTYFVEIIGPRNMLESFIWDLGPIINWLKGHEGFDRKGMHILKKLPVHLILFLESDLLISFLISIICYLLF